MAVFTLKSGDSEDQVHITPAKEMLVSISSSFPLPVTLAQGWSHFSQSTPSHVSVSNASTTLLTANPNRLFASFSNNSTQTIYIQYGNAAVFGVGYVVRPNSCWIIGSNELFLGQINAITQTGSVNIDIIEGVL